MFWLTVVLQSFVLPFLIASCSFFKKDNGSSKSASGGMPRGGPSSDKKSQSEQGLKDSTSSRKPLKGESQVSITEKTNQLKFGGLDMPADDDDEPKTNLTSMEDGDNPLLNPEVRARLMKMRNKKKTSKEKKNGSGRKLKTEATIATVMMPVDLLEEKTQEEDLDSCKTRKNGLTTADVTVELNKQYLKGRKQYSARKKGTDKVHKGSGETKRGANAKVDGAGQQEEALQTQTQLEYSAREEIKFSAETQSAAGFLSNEPTTMKKKLTPETISKYY